MKLIPLVCPKCGIEEPPKFSYAGPHIKARCSDCGSYIKFYNPKLIPDVREIKLAIWYLTDQNLDLINEFKKEVEFTEQTGLTQKLMYWRLYHKALKHFHGR